MSKESKRCSVPVALVAGCVALAAVASAQEMPQPGPEYQSLEFFVGRWQFEGEAKEGPMGPGGKVTLTETCELWEGGFAIVCRAEGKNPMGTSKTVGIMSYDSGKQAYTYYAAESNTPVFSAMGKRDGKTWIWSSEMSMGPGTTNVRVTMVETSPMSYTFKMEMSGDGTNWMPAMEGKYTKAS